MGCHCLLRSSPESPERPTSPFLRANVPSRSAGLGNEDEVVHSTSFKAAAAGNVHEMATLFHLLLEFLEPAESWTKSCSSVSDERRVYQVMGLMPSSPLTFRQPAANAKPCPQCDAKGAVSSSLGREPPKKKAGTGNPTMRGWVTS